MKILFVTCLVGLLVCACSSSKPAPDATSGSAPTTAHPKLLVLDVRSPEEFKSGHLNGAVNVPVDELNQKIAQVAPDKDTPIAVHCQSGGRSARAKKALDSMGYSHVEDLGSLAHARQVVEGAAQ